MFLKSVIGSLDLHQRWLIYLSSVPDVFFFVLLKNLKEEYVRTSVGITKGKDLESDNTGMKFPISKHSLVKQLCPYPNNFGVPISGILVSPIWCLRHLAKQSTFLGAVYVPFTSSIWASRPSAGLLFWQNCLVWKHRPKAPWDAPPQVFSLWRLPDIFDVLTFGIKGMESIFTNIKMHFLMK